jgi:hypothetical protein
MAPALCFSKTAEPPAAAIVIAMAPQNEMDLIYQSQGQLQPDVFVCPLKEHQIIANGKGIGP